jgi:hypothetical protein
VLYPISILCGKLIQNIKCDLCESRHLNIVNLTEVYQGLFGTKEDIARDIKPPEFISGCLICNDLNFMNMNVVHLSKYIVIAFAKPLKVGDALILVKAALSQWIT